jgi:hypothetical protein
MGKFSEMLKDLEVVFTILIACSAALAGIAGYLATKANGEASGASQNAQLSFNDANTYYLEANQYILRDNDLLTQAALADYEEKPEVAEFLRNQTYMCQSGFIEYDGSVSSEYSGDFDIAWAAYNEDLYQLYNLSWEDSQIEFANADAASVRADSYLLSTVLLAISATFGTVGLAIDAHKLKLVFLVIVALFIALSILILISA